MNLYAFYLGGKAKGANIEVHDIVFAVGEEIEDCYDQCRKSWFGNLDGLHIDAWTKVTCIDGFKVDVVCKDFAQLDESESRDLYFINLGASRNDEFFEQHRNVFIVSSSELEAKNRAKSWFKFESSLPEIHVDNIIKLALIQNEYRVILTVAPYNITSKPVACYIPI